MNTFTEKEKVALVKIREKLTDLKLDEEKSRDAYLIKWLRARDLNISKSEAMLRQHLKWREENKVDQILSWEAPKIFSQMYPLEVAGFNKYGCPIVVVTMRYMDVDTFLSMDKEAYSRYSTQNMEKMYELMRSKSTPENPVTEIVIIQDLQGVNFRPFMNREFFSFQQKMTNQFNDNYPECMYKAYFLFAPKFFTTMFGLMKYMFPKRTLEKFEVYGDDPQSWIGSMIEHMDLDQIPAKYGGTNYEFGKTAFAQCIKPNDVSNVDFTTVKVPAGKKHAIDYHIDTPNSELSWIFKTIDYDISFALIYETEEEVIPASRVDSAKKHQSGKITCEKVGRYSLIFDNSYSRYRSKSLHFYVQVENIDVINEMVAESGLVGENPIIMADNDHNDSNKS